MKKLIALVLAMAFVVAACSSNSTEDAVDTYCDDLGTLKTSLESLNELTAQSTVDDVNNAKEAVKSAYDATVASAENVDGAVAGEIDTAQSTWQSTVDAIPGDATVADSLTAIQTADAAYLASVNTAVDKVDCSN
jgi:hypothetical protein